MGRTLVTATINGPKATKDYSFLVDTGSTLMGLPLEEIQALSLVPIPRGMRRFMTATGVVERETYAALGAVEGRGFNTTVIPAPIPLIGYEFLENLRLRMNPVTQKLEPVPDEVEDHPPYLLPIVARDMSGLSFLRPGWRGLR